MQKSPSLVHSKLLPLDQASRRFVRLLVSRSLFQKLDCGEPVSYCAALIWQLLEWVSTIQLQKYNVQWMARLDCGLRVL